jgi:hypothetical protein
VDARTGIGLVCHNPGEWIGTIRDAHASRGRNRAFQGGNDENKEGNDGAKDRNDDDQEDSDYDEEYSDYDDEYNDYDEEYSAYDEEDSDDDQRGDRELTVWNYYGDRGEYYDRDLIGDANNTVDSLLIFVSGVYTSHPGQLIKIHSNQGGSLLSCRNSFHITNVPNAPTRPSQHSHCYPTRNPKPWEYQQARTIRHTRICHTSQLLSIRWTLHEHDCRFPQHPHQTMGKKLST